MLAMGRALMVPSRLLIVDEFSLGLARSSSNDLALRENRHLTRSELRRWAGRQQLIAPDDPARAALRSQGRQPASLRTFGTTPPPVAGRGWKRLTSCSIKGDPVVSIHRRSAAAPETAGSAPLLEPLACRMGPAGRDVCMRDPNRLAHWPRICRVCNENTTSYDARAESPAPR
jgi:hypothetical protein